MTPKILISVDDFAYTLGVQAKWGIWNGLANLSDYFTYECLLKFVLGNSAFLIEQGVTEQDIGMLPKSSFMRRVPGDQFVTKLPDADFIIITGYFGNNIDLELDFSQLENFQGKVIFFGFGLNQGNDTYESFKRSAQQLKRFGPIFCQDETTLTQVQSCGLEGRLVGPLQFMLLPRDYFKCADQLFVSEILGSILDELITELARTNQQANFDLAHKVRLPHYPVRRCELEPIMSFEAKKLFTMYVSRASKVITASPLALYLCLAVGIPVRYLSDHSLDSAAQSALFERMAVEQDNDGFVRYQAGDLGLYQRQLLLSLIQDNSELAQQATKQLNLFWAQL